MAQHSPTRTIVLPVDPSDLTPEDLTRVLDYLRQGGHLPAEEPLEEPKLMVMTQAELDLAVARGSGYCTHCGIISHFAGVALDGQEHDCGWCERETLCGMVAAQQLGLVTVFSASAEASDRQLPK